MLPFTPMLPSTPMFSFTAKLPFTATQRSPRVRPGVFITSLRHSTPMLPSTPMFSFTPKLMFWNQARPLKPKDLVEIHGVGSCLNQTHPLKPRNTKENRFWRILESDHSVVSIEFLKKISIPMFWKKTSLLKSKKTLKNAFLIFWDQARPLKAKELMKKMVLGFVWTRPIR